MEIPPPLMFPHPSHSIHLSIVSKIGGLNSSGDKNQKLHSFSHAQHSSFFIRHSSSVIRHSSLFILTPSTEGGHIITNFDNPYFSEGAIYYLVGSKRGDLTILTTNRRKNYHTPSSKTLKPAKDSILPYHHFSLSSLSRVVDQRVLGLLGGASESDISKYSIIALLIIIPKKIDRE